MNGAIVAADISQSFEEYLEILDHFYAEDIERTTDTMKEPVHGKQDAFGRLATVDARSADTGSRQNIEESSAGQFTSVSSLAESDPGVSCDADRAVSALLVTSARAC